MDNPIRAAAAGSARGVSVCECFFLLGVFILEGALLMPRHTHSDSNSSWCDVGDVYWFYLEEMRRTGQVGPALCRSAKKVDECTDS